MLSSTSLMEGKKYLVTITVRKKTIMDGDHLNCVVLLASRVIE